MHFFKGFKLYWLGPGFSKNGNTDILVETLSIGSHFTANPVIDSYLTSFLNLDIGGV